MLVTHLALVAIGAAPTANTNSAFPLAYVRASSQLERQSRPAHYHPMNLLDGDTATSWCENAEGPGEHEEVQFFFKKAQPIDKIVIKLTQNTGRTILVIKLSDGTNTVALNVQEGESERVLDRPLRGTTYTAIISQVGAAQPGSALDPDTACIADILMYSKNRLYGGSLSTNIYRYDKYREQLLGPWSGEPLGASEKFITFALDGTWSWQYQKLLGGKEITQNGEYRFRGDRLLMRKGTSAHWADVRFQYKRIRVDPSEIGAPKSDYDRISINAALGEELAGGYTNARFE